MNHIEYQGNTPDEYEHYRQLRINPMYRMDCRLAELEARNAPSLASMQSPEPEPVRRPEPAWTRRQWDYVRQLEARVQHAEARLNDHVDRAIRAASERSITSAF